MRDVKVRWNDPNLIENGHKVYRSYTPMDINNLPDAIAILGRDETEYIDEGIDSDINVYYMVSAFIDNHEVFSEEYTLLPKGNEILITSSWYGDIKVFNEDMTTINWTQRAYNSRIYALERDNNGNILVAYSNNVNILVKFNPLGDVIWEYSDYVGYIQCMKLGDDGLIYFITASSILYSIDSGGNKVNQLTLPNAVTSNSRVGMHIENNKLWYLSSALVNHFDLSTNTIIWTHPYTYSQYESNLHVDFLGNCYTEHNGIIKIDSSGNEVWRSQTGSYTSFTTDVDMNVYASSRSKGITKLAEDGTLIWNISTGSSFSVQVDTNGNVYFDERNTSTINRVDMNGNNKTVLATNDTDVSYAILVK